MDIRTALIMMSPSLALQRAAADEIARLDALVRRQQDEINQLKQGVQGGQEIPDVS